MATLVGRTLGHYRITEKIGEGGMGAVYRARDQRLEREVAIKVLPETLAEDPGRLERFEREARAAAALDHPNILAIHELGSHEDRPFIVTELLEGCSLRDHLADGPPVAEVGLDWCRQMAKGLAAAHEKGIVHRDLKPENVFVTSDGTVKILDFGLAKLVPAAGGEGVGTEAATETMHTAAGTVMGTSGYMSPEQVRGQVVDPRSDVFSFGVVLYEMVTGSNPFRKATAADSVSAVLSESPPDLSEWNRPVPTGLDRIVSRCLAKRPEDRFRSAAEIVGALQGPSGELPSVASSRRGRRRRARMLTTVAVVVALAAVAGYLALRQVAERELADGLSAQPPRVVILPFENLGSGEHDYFAAGITDELTSRLASVPRLQVVLGSDTVQISDGVVIVGGEPDVDYALNGTVRWNRPSDGPVQVRITPKLLRISDARVLWSESYDRRLDDIFQIQSEIAGRVLEALDIALLITERDALETQPTANMEAYQAYLRGLYYGESSIEEELYLAVAMFEQAVELDPGFALAHAELAMAHARLVSDRVDVSPSRIASAGAAADRALELEPGLARAHLARAVSLAWAGGRSDEARRELDTALALSPNDPRILLSKGLWLLITPSADHGRSSMEEAVEVFGQVLDLDPENYQAQKALGDCLGALRKHAAADLAFQRAIRLQPDRLPAYLSRYWNALAWEGGTGLAREVLESVPADRHRDVLELRLFTEMAERRFDRVLDMVGEMPASWVESPVWLWPTELVECHAYRGLGQVLESEQACQVARTRIQAALDNRPDDPRLWIALGNSEALLGNAENAVRAAERALELAKATIFDQSQFTVHPALIHAMVGNADQAVRGLSAALERPGWTSRAWLAFDWRLDQIRDDPGFQRLVEGR